MTSGWKFIIAGGLVVILAVAGVELTQRVNSHQPLDVSARQAAIALEVAMEKVGAPYVWGSRGPDTFDSSGIIVHAYRQAIPAIRFRVGGDFLPEYADDATHRAIYEWNFRESALDELRPGDLVYITDGSAPVTHGMLFVDWVEEGRIMEVLDASSRLMRVVVQSWPVHEQVRGQTLVAVGRLQINAREDWLRHEPEAP